MAKRGNIPKSGPGSRWGSTPARKPQSGAAGPGADKPEPYPIAAQPGPAGPARPSMPGATYDSQYTADTGRVNWDANQGGIELDQQADRLGFDTGYGAGGVLDPRNPYSQAMALQKAWRENRSGTSVSMAARGQLYSGARSRQLEDVDYRRNASSKQLEESARRGHEGITNQRQRLEAGRTFGVADAQASQAQRWTEQQNEWMRLYG